MKGVFPGRYAVLAPHQRPDGFPRLTIPVGIRLDFRVNSKNRLAGRFLPSRVYARWKWTVRCGLCAVPLILFLAGSVVVYLQPNRYQSTAVFKYSGERPAAEVVALLKSRSLFDRVCEQTAMPQTLEIPQDTAFEMMSHLVKTQVDPASGMIEVKVTHTFKEVARDLAAGLPKALDDYEAGIAERELNDRRTLLRQSLIEAEDEAEFKGKFLSKLISVRGETPADPAARVDLDAARADWENVRKRVLENEMKERTLAESSKERRKWVEVISEPQISDSPVEAEGDETMAAVILRSLGTGLGLALVVPYLLELLFPRVRKTGKPERPAKYEEPVLANATAGR